MHNKSRQANLNLVHTSDLLSVLYMKHEIDFYYISQNGPEHKILAHGVKEKPL